MPPSLSQSDVDRLLIDTSTETRAAVAGKLGADIDSPDLSDAEVRSAQDIIRVMALDVEVAVRVALSRSLRRTPRLPRDVALRLASDVETVALPVLSHSPVLTDDDLIEVIRQGSATKQGAVANRAVVHDTVSAALVLHADAATVATLMQNPGACVSEQSLNRAIDRFVHSEAVKEGIVRRDALPVIITERLVAIVSHRLREHLVLHHKLPPAVATEVVLQSRERTTLGLSAGIGWQQLRQLVRQMQHSGRLTPSLLLRALCIGDMAFFEAALATMAGVPIENAQLLIHDSGRNGFAAIYEKSGLPQEIFPILRAAIDVIDGTTLDGDPHDLARFRSRVTARVLTQFNDFNEDDLDYLLARLGDALAVA